MSDVILYAAIKENIKLQQEYLEFCTGGGSGGIAFYQNGNTQGGFPYAGDAGGDEFSLCPSLVQDWVNTLCPVLNTDLTCGFKVCDTSGYYRCGNNCTWCVPPGVCCAQFQLWGPGGGTSGMCCCGGSPHGPSGAWMVVQMPVSPGECYCLCSGCAYCCYASLTDPGICGSPTWIRSGNNDFCVCVDSGISCMCYWSGDLELIGGRGGECGIPASDGCAAPACNGGYNFCYDGGNQGTSICHAYATRTTFHMVNQPSDGRDTVYYGINGLWPAICLGDGSSNCLHGSCTLSTPVFGFENCVCGSRFTSSDSGEAYGGCYYQASSGYLQIPSVGGYHTYYCGGESSRDGDSGGMGMICVSYICN